MLSTYFETSRQIVESYGGTVEKFIGDAVMALWGAPVAREDDAERAVRAALDLVAAVTRMGDRLGTELRLRSGVLTGEAAVELQSAAEGMVVGDAVNTASRIQSVALPGWVLVDDVTRLVTERAIVYEDGGTHTVKGKAEQLQTWHALRVVAALGGAGRSGIELPLVGRSREIGVLRCALDNVLAPGAGLRIIFMVGEAGLGKSRLAWELEKYADGLAAQVLWSRGRVRCFGEGVGFWALADMVRMRAQIAHGEDAATQRTKMSALLDSAVRFRPRSDPEVHERMERGLSRLLGLDSVVSGVIDRERAVHRLATAVRAPGEDAPLVLLLEDLQWADEGLFDFIEHMSQWAAASPILMLVSTRPDERLAPLLGLGEHLPLAPLSGEEIEELVAAAVLDVPAGLLRRVSEHAGGVPLFAVESLRMLADRGLLLAERDSGRYRVLGEVQDLDVPPSVHALVAARLDRLGTLERRVLLNGAVLGHGFTAAGVAALTGLSERDVRSLAAGLVAKQFLSVASEPRSPERGQFTFSHRLVQRVARSTLSRRERKACHLAAVDHLSSGESDPDLAAILAGHLLAAVEAEPAAADAEGIRRRALSTTLDAAERADSVGALAQAIALYDRAADIEPDELQRAEHLIRAARCAERSGDQAAAAAERYAAARALHERNGRSRDGLRLLACEVYAHRWTRRNSQLLGPLWEVYEKLRSEPDGLFADAAASLSNVLYGDGDAPAAERIAAEAAVAAQQSGAWHALGIALNSRASALLDLGRPIEALEIFQEALETSERHEPAEAPAALGNIAITLCALGRFEEAAATGRRTMAAGRARRASRGTEHGAQRRGWTELQIARSLFSLGRWDEALATVERAAAEAAPAYEGMTIGPPVLAACYRGQPDVAREVIARFDERQAESGSAFESDYRCLREAAIAHLDGDGSRAASIIVSARAADYAEWPAWLALTADLVAQSADLESLERALAALRETVAPRTSPIVVAQTARLAAHHAARAGDSVEAATHWQAAHAAAHDAGMAFDAAVMALELAEHHVRLGGVAPTLGESRATFAALRAEPWAKRARMAADVTRHAAQLS